MSKVFTKIDNHDVAISNPDKVLWPEVGITKATYLRYLAIVAPFMLLHTMNRPLMVWRFPDGVDKTRIVQKAVPTHAPDWIPRAPIGDKDYVLLNDLATLAWVANYGAIELHVPFSVYPNMNIPTHLAFDLDPSVPDHFDLVLETAQRLHQALESLGLNSFPKTSGATGIQIFVPIEPRYTFEQTRVLMRFLAVYIEDQMPDKVTLERSVRKRGTKLYLDYLQLWKMRTLSAVYSVRATPTATVSTPVTWAEIKHGFQPTDFTMDVVEKRIATHGDLFATVASPIPSDRHSIDEILQFIQGHR